MTDRRYTANTTKGSTRSSARRTQRQGASSLTETASHKAAGTGSNPRIAQHSRNTSRTTRTSSGSSYRSPSHGSLDSPIVKFVVLPLATAVAFVCVGVVISCAGGFAVM